MHPPIPLEAQREAALRILRRLRAAGHEAWFVGGCVRDELLGRPPREYDVATSAHPPEIEAIFDHTVPVGRQFGVLLVVERHVPIEVATFRSDEAYVDGRRPTAVRFTTAREDAERRDFTVNGLFLDPESGEVHDFVGGRADLLARRLRAIGEPRERFAEDKLRLMRAVRFATTLPLEVEPRTWAAVVEMGPLIGAVAWERIREELSRILVSGRSAQGLRMLREAGMLPVVLPEVEAMDGVPQPPEYHPEGDVLVHTLLAMEQFDRLPERPLALGLATLLHDVGKPGTYSVAERIRFDGHDRLGAELAEAALRRLRYPNEVVHEVRELVARHMAFVQIREWRPAKVRRFLTGPLAERHLALHRLDCLACHGRLGTWEWCNARRAEFAADPPPPPRLLGGDDLLAAGYAPGPRLGRVLAAVDDRRLEGGLTTKEDALAWALEEYPPEGDALPGGEDA